jgi:hypothetical protein
LTKPNRIVEPKRDAPRRKFRQGGVKQKNILRARKGQCDDFCRRHGSSRRRQISTRNENRRVLFRLRQNPSQAKICL